MTVRLAVDEARLRSVFASVLGATIGGVALWLSGSCAAADSNVAVGPGDASDEVGDTNPTADVVLGPPVPVCSDGVDAAHEQIDGTAYIDAADESGGACDLYVRFNGCTPTKPIGAACKFTLAVCAAACGFTTSGGCAVTPDNCFDGGVINGDQVVINCTKCLGGRRPEAFRERAPRREDDVVGDWFARLAEIECASIGAFRTLRDELRIHGAPSELCARARSAARDEVRHTRAASRLAARFGGHATFVPTRRESARPLEAIATENAVEGCVRETYGALVAAWQARRARDADVRAALAQIAVDELGHAALAWAIAAWIEPLLDGEARARVCLARARAVDEMRVEARSDPHTALVEIAGLPTARESAALLDGAASFLWAA